MSNKLLAILVFFSGASSGWWLPAVAPGLSIDAQIILSILLGGFAGWFAAGIWFD